MSLKKYISKRKFNTSPEPQIKSKSKKKESRFVIQKHAASHLHYDFRIEVDGVLKSWAIPKGPSLDPSVKRLAIMVEDHPLEYRNFEGIIPQGYGAGSVMIWDKGTYSVDRASGKEAEIFMREGLEKGAIHFSLEGEKLHGNFSLVKLKKDGNEWLLIKKKDNYISTEDPGKKDRSVVSGRTLDEITSHSPSIPILKPMLATLVDEPFDDKNWIFEIKLDGFRALAEIKSKQANIYSRNSQRFNQRFPSIAQDLEELKCDAILDGEIVALNEKGLSQFQLLQRPISEENIYYYVFDILSLNGKDLRSLPLLKRKSILKNILKKNSHVRYLDHIEEKGKAFFTAYEKEGGEGIIGKKKESLYTSGERSQEWIKTKTENIQEVVICGFTEPKKSRKNFGALIVGVYKKGRLEFAGHVGGGFSEKELKEVKAKLIPLLTQNSPFKILPISNTAVTWVKPELLCNVKFREWTKEGIMRQPIFLGIRTDKSPKSVVKEKPKSAKKIEKGYILSTYFHPEKYPFANHLEKLYWDKEGITKRDLLGYYESIASYILPYLKDRPESLKRSPNGITKPSFFQKNLQTYPEWISTVSIEQQNRMINYLVIQDIESLLYAVNLGCIEIHPWLSRHQNIENPDFLIIDLDPVDIPFEAVVETALVIHTILEDIKVPSFCKTSGARGLHIAIPLKAKYTYEEAKHFAQLIAILANRKCQSFTSLERNPKKRQGKVYIDCLQNNFGQTLAAPYSVRAKPGASVSTPLEWNELKEGLNPLDYNIFNTLDRLKKKGDLFKPILKSSTNIPKALIQIQKLIQLN